MYFAKCVFPIIFHWIDIRTRSTRHSRGRNDGRICDRATAKVHPCERIFLSYLSSAILSKCFFYSSIMPKTLLFLYDYKKGKSNCSFVIISLYYFRLILNSIQSVWSRVARCVLICRRVQSAKKDVTMTVSAVQVSSRDWYYLWLNDSMIWIWYSDI